MSASALWTAVVAAYDSQGLEELTNPRNPETTSVNTTIGQSAAQHFIDLFPIYAEVAYSASDTQHVAIGLQGTIAVLFRRGGASTTIDEVKWDTVFGQDGLLSKLRNTTTRQRLPLTTSAPDTDSSGNDLRGWSHKKSMPSDFLPSDVIDDGT